MALAAVPPLRRRKSSAVRARNPGNETFWCCSCGRGEMTPAQRDFEPTGLGEYDPGSSAWRMRSAR
jgi:hypothetical protein